jgi:hypothetical protein
MRAYSALLAVLGYMGSLTQWQRLVGPLIAWGWAGRPPTPRRAGGGEGCRGWSLTPKSPIPIS